MFFRLQNSPYFRILKYARAVKQKVWHDAENGSERLLRHSLPISLLILRKKPAVLQSICSLKFFSACTYTYVSIILKEVALPQERQESKSWILDSALWIPDSRYLVPDFLSVKLEFRIPVVSGVSDSLSWN